MKSVGKQMQEARLAKNWTPELAARETKIKVDRLRDLEADDYTHFSSPTYARGFVRTYARCLGLDEYKILRQLDNKLPDDDSSNIVTDSGVPYLPETSMPPRVAHRDYTGLYVVGALGLGVVLIISFVLLEAYRVGELPRYFAHDSSSEDVTTPAETNAAPAVSDTDAAPHALPVDPNDTSHAPKAQPVDLTAEATNTNSNAPAATPPTAPVATTTDSEAPPHALRALPVNPADLGNGAPATQPPTPPVALPVTATSASSMASINTKTPPRALPVDPSELANVATTNGSTPPPVATAPSQPNPSAPIAPAAQTPPAPSNSGPVVMPPATVTPPTPNDPDKRLVLTASQDSFVRVTSLDAADTEKTLYASVLHSGQSVGFDGRKFSINVGVPSAVDIKLDGVNYGPHSDQDAPETFTVESHLP